jgi:hypothetical protein
VRTLIIGTAQTSSANRSQNCWPTHFQFCIPTHL